MSFLQFISDTLRNKYKDFDGRASLGEYLYFQLFVVLVYGVVLLGFGAWESYSLRDLKTNVATPHILFWLSLVWAVLGVILFLPSIAITVRRLHDMEKSGWWLLGIAVAIGVLGAFGLPEVLAGAIGFFVLTRAGGRDDNFYGILPSTKIKAPWAGFMKRPVVNGLISGLALLGVVVVSHYAFFKPIEGYLPIKNADGTTQYHLVEGKDGSDWVLRLPSDLNITDLDHQSRFRPAFGGARNDYIGVDWGLRIFASLALKEELALHGDTNGAVPVSLSIYGDKIDLPKLDLSECVPVQEISAGLIVVSENRENVEKEYAGQSERYGSFENFYRYHYRPLCLKYGNPNEDKYVLSDIDGGLVGIGICDDECEFKLFLPNGRDSFMKLQKKDLAVAQNLYSAFVGLLEEATDLGASVNYP